MDCQEFLNRHSEFLDELLSDEQADRFRVHVAACAACGRYDRVVRRGVEVLRGLPAPELSRDFEVRLGRRLTETRDVALIERGAGTGAAVSLVLAAMLALAAWGPLLRADEAATGRARVDVAREAQRPPVDPGLLPAPDWWHAPQARVFGSGDVRRVEVAFPGPYSPLIVMPPVTRSAATAQLGVAVRTASWTALE